MILALQTYTIRKECKEDLVASLNRVVQMGISHIELARVPFDKQTLNAIQQTPIQVVAIQEKFHKLARNVLHYVSFCQELKCNIVCVSVLELQAILCGHQAMKRFAKKLNQLAWEYHKHGIQLAFHHHDFEFKQVRGKMKVTTLIESTNEQVAFVLDTYWATRSNQDVLELIRNIGPRLIGFHLRDCVRTSSTTCDGALGTGVVDFKGLLKQIPPTIVYGAIEQNSSQPFQDLNQSIKYLTSIQIKENV